MKRQTICIFLSLFFLWSLAACGGETAETAFLPASTPPVESTETPETTLPAETVPTVTQGDLFAGTGEDRVLAAVLYYPAEEDLDQLNIPNAITLMTLDNSDGTYYDEVLVVPRHGDCTVTVETVEWQEDGSFYVTGSLGSMGPADDKDTAVGGVRIRTLIPEGSPSLQVTVTRREKTGSFLLGYDGRGDGLYYILADG